MLVAIHQPNFFPWLGYFEKVAKCDRFVVLDHVQLPKTGGSWLNHVQLLVGGEPRWLTAPVRKVAGVQSIDRARFDGGPWRRKAVATLQAAYGRAPHFAEAMALLEPLIVDEDDRLADYNRRALLAIIETFGIDGQKIVRSSELGVEGSATELLIALVKAVGGNAYLAGGGAGGYQDDAAFERAGIALVAQGFTPRPYPQHGARAFVPGLSVIDALMNLGIAGTAEHLRQGRQ